MYFLSQFTGKLCVFFIVRDKLIICVKEQYMNQRFRSDYECVSSGGASTILYYLNLSKTCEVLADIRKLLIMQNSCVADITLKCFSMPTFVS